MALEARGYIDDGASIGLSEGEVHYLLASQRRRLALDVLAEGGPWELEDLAAEIVSRERPNDVTERAVRRAEIALYHCHLPLMDDLGAIEFDRRSMRVDGCRLIKR